MAFFECYHRSDALDKRMQFNVIIPEWGNREYDIPTVYLLHGLYDDYTMWSRMTSVERYANALGVAIVMPDGAKSFYTDMDCGYKYFTYVSEEIVDYTRKIFKLSHDADKTFVCGNSMGGYGAFKLALSHPETFGSAVSLSGALDIAEWNDRKLWDEDAVAIWGKDGFGKIKGSKNDLFRLADDCVKSGKPLPRLYQICGTEDFLYGSNIRFRDYIKTLPFESKYKETPGGHDWGFWDGNLEDALDFMTEKL